MARSTTPPELAQHARSSATPFVMCADDYGMTPGICIGILKLIRQNRINATSVMSLSPHWIDWATPLRELRDQVDVGLHLDWTSPFAIEKGFGTSLTLLMARSTCRLLRNSTVERAIEQQLDLFEAHFKARPDHVDGHQHIHQFPVIRELLLRVLSRRYAIHDRPWIRIARVKENPPSLKSHVINAMGADALQRLAIQYDFAHSDSLSGVYNFQGNAQLYLQHLHNWLTHMTSGTVLMCHPGTEPCDQAPSPRARLWEQAVLEGQSFQAMLNSTQTTLVRGTALFPYSDRLADC
jgi:predicted glycoside hydrolase/deacetylase ChbG (UPF0249 family)